MERGGYRLECASCLQAERAALVAARVADARYTESGAREGHSNWSRNLMRDGASIFVDAESALPGGEFNQWEADEGTCLFQLVCESVACRWPAEPFCGMAVWEQDVTGDIYALRASYGGGGAVCYLETYSTGDCQLCSRCWAGCHSRNDGSLGWSRPETAADALRWHPLSYCEPSEDCEAGTCNVRRRTFARKPVAALGSVPLPGDDWAGFQASLAPGDKVRFGRWPQSCKDALPEPIEWLVLAREGTKALLLSARGLATMPANENANYGYLSLPWEDCGVRDWLNERFLPEAFMSHELQAIVATELGNAVEDRVFCLSAREVKDLFANDVARVCKPTRAACELADGAPADAKKSCSWWLRTPGEEEECMSYVDASGRVDAEGVWAGSGDELAIRPAMWVRLGAAGG